ncbi:isoniazid inducible gene protein iniC [Actinokineospora spheciospongiae]|uniref:Isoniazid inducible gene protein iniC n=1 Tax=Actinokineospora spheciospongiae TaxID=909613 RepID=W7J0T2_9PSEU|nr:hypothetical protein [Actinokineospora spheciospongiae]EWC59724.1 isoniazid inducible gene protein iniC [Actinokineospora spheciospongiae]
MNLAEAAWSLLERALPHYRDSPRAEAFLGTAMARLTGPLRVTVTGPPRSGRTTLLNAVVGEPVPPGTDRLTVDWPGDVELVDAPETDTDAVVHLLPHPAADTRPLRPAAAVSTLVVLSRADELGGGRVDALVSARQVARRRARSAELGGLCQDVLAVAGSLALGASLLTPTEASALAALGRVPRAELDPVLLSADRFATAFPAEGPALLTRLGLFGVRLAATQARRGLTGAALAAELVRASGITELRTAIGTRFAERSPVLRARTALLGLEAVLRREPRAPALAAEVERVLAGAHELRELRLLADLDTGRVSLGEEVAEARYLLGAQGTTPAARLAVSDDAHTAVLRWRAHAEDPRRDSRARRAALVVVRSCEELVTRGATTAP